MIFQNPFKFLNPSLFILFIFPGIICILSCNSSEINENLLKKSDVVIRGSIFGHELNYNTEKDKIEARIGCIVTEIHKGDKIQIRDTIILLYYFNYIYDIRDNQNYILYLKRPPHAFEFIYEIIDKTQSTAY